MYSIKRKKNAHGLILCSMVVGMHPVSFNVNSHLLPGGNPLYVGCLKGKNAPEESTVIFCMSSRTQIMNFGRLTETLTCHQTDITPLNVGRGQTDMMTMDFPGDTTVAAQKAEEMGNRAGKRAGTAKTRKSIDHIGQEVKKRGHVVGVEKSANAKAIVCPAPEVPSRGSGAILDPGAEAERARAVPSPGVGAERAKVVLDPEAEAEGAKAVPSPGVGAGKARAILDPGVEAERARAILDLGAVLDQGAEARGARVVLDPRLKRKTQKAQIHNRTLSRYVRGGDRNAVNNPKYTIYIKLYFF